MNTETVNMKVKSTQTTKRQDKDIFIKLFFQGSLFHTSSSEKNRQFPIKKKLKINGNFEVLINFYHFPYFNWREGTLDSKVHW